MSQSKSYDCYNDSSEEITVRMKLPYPLPYTEKRYPGVGLLIAFSVGLAFWSTVIYFIAR